MATTGANTAAQWNTAATNATEAAYAADAKAFAAEQAISDAKGNVYRANTALEAAKQSGDPAAIAAANQQLQAANNSVVQQTAVAAEYRTQATNAGNDAATATELAAKNSGETPSTPPPVAAPSTPAAPATSYTPEPPVQPVTSPSPALLTPVTPPTTTVTVTNTTSTASETGGTSTTNYGSTSTLTPEAANTAKLSTDRAAAFTANPDGKFGPGTIDRAASTGAITQEEAAALKAGAIPREERFAVASEANAKSREAVDKGTIETSSGSTTSATPNSSGNTVSQQSTAQSPPPALSVTEDPGISKNSQVVTNTDGSKTVVETNNATATQSAVNVTGDPITQSVQGTSVASLPVENPAPVATTDPAVQPATDQTAAETARLNRAPETTTDPNLAQQAATSDNFNDKRVVAQEPNVAQDTAGANNFNDKKTVDDTNIAQAQATDNNFNDKKTVADDPNVQQAAATDNNFNDKKDAAFYDPALQAQRDAATSAASPTATTGAATGGAATGPQGLNPLKDTQSKATQQDAVNFKKKEDWRVRLSLAPNSKYLYNAEPAGILGPLRGTDGVIFPYTPSISVNYAAHYDTTELIHNNYKAVQYKSSSVDQITIGCDFTAQDTNEANYMLAVIHFFRSVTKMFYGQDALPKPGTPPPLCYLSGLGEFQFDAHPLVITNFNYTLPIDVDYIRAGSSLTQPGVNTASASNSPNAAFGQDPASVGAARLAGLNPGATAKPPTFNNAGVKTPATYVPTKMNIQITAMPIVTRTDISKNFSLRDYATGKLLQGSITQRGGIW